MTYTLAGKLSLLFLLLLACTPSQYSDGVVTLRDKTYRVAVASTPEQHAKGLMNRTSLPPDSGMLFVFPDTTPRTFWMKNTLIPLDILFIDANMTLVTIYRNVPPCNSVPCPTYPSNASIAYVLELNAGMADTVSIGQTISYMG